VAGRAFLWSVIHRPTMTVKAALEYRTDDNYQQIRAALKCRLVFTSARHGLDDDSVVAGAIAATLTEHWPGRAHRILVGDLDESDWMELRGDGTP
jgi:hypothetical protein